MPPAPFSQVICNLKASADTKDDFTIEFPSVDSIWPEIDLAPSIDLRQPWWEVGHQLETGSCVGWAVADGAIRFLLTEKERIEPGLRLSPRFTWMASKEFDTIVSQPESFIERAGTTIKSAADVSRKYGTALESQVPLIVDGAMYSGEPKHLFADAARRKILSYYNLFLDFKSWRRLLNHRVPIVIGLKVDLEWKKAPQGLLTEFNPLFIFGGHAACIVGYREDGRFIVRNSWGPTWGEGGYAYATEKYLKAACFFESYAFYVG